LLVSDVKGAGSRSVEAVVEPHRGNGGYDVRIDGVTIPVHLKGGVGRHSRDRHAHGATGPGPQRRPRRCRAKSSACWCSLVPK
jgi:hypothetical protein